MRKVTFKKVDDQWTSTPFQGWQYRIIQRWLKGYVLYHNGMTLRVGTRLNEMKRLAQEHLDSAYNS